MKISRCCLASSAVAGVFAVVAIWQFYAHIDQGITLAYSKSVSDERAQTIEQLQTLALGELRGKTRDDIIRLVEGQGRTWFSKDDENLIIADTLVFEFDGERLKDIRSAFGGGD
ncbi:MAG TPA: Imm58 family immunity protein [Dongiaceae bacterium]|jgi:hypothetical protein